MTSSNELVERYLAIWNERDDAKRRALIEKTWVEQPSYVDPLMNAASVAELDAFVDNVQGQFPGYEFRPVGTADLYGDRIRFSWEVVNVEDGSSPAAGTDFGIISQDGRFVAVTGFLDRVPVAS
jgi:hypothetical protein